MTLHKLLMSGLSWKAMKGGGDFPAPEHDGTTCVECGGEAELDEHDECVRCLDDDCGHEEGYEDPRISAAEDARDDVDWGYEGPY